MSLLPGQNIALPMKGWQKVSKATTSQYLKQHKRPQLTEEIRLASITQTDVVIHPTQHHLVLGRKTLTSDPAETRP